MIRLAAPDDIPACLAMGRRFFDASGYAGESSYCEQSTEATFRNLIQSMDGVLLVAEHEGELVGMVGALAFPLYFNTDAKTAQELFWWVDADARGGMAGVRLLQALEAWATGRGCKTLMMVGLAIESPAERIYTRMGYRATERTYIKRL